MKWLNLCLFLLILHYIEAADGESCKTPDEQPGECILIKNCAPLYAFLKKRPIPVEKTTFLRRSHCGFQGEIPKVCCPTGNTSILDKASMPEDDVLPESLSNLLPSTRDCGVDLGRKILGGTEVDLDEFPWMALLIYELPNGQRDYGCGGVLISDRYVLTAAHCLKGKSLPKLWRLTAVRLGEYNKDSDEDCTSNGYNTYCLTSPPINVTIEERIAHEKYNPVDDDQKYDIALLRLEKKVKYTDYIKPICLPTLEEERKKTYSGLNLTVCGWGQTENRSSSSIKLKLLVPVMALSDCQLLYSEANKGISEKQMCAGGQQNKDSCRGDSGGPLMSISVDENGDANWYLAGIVSYGPVPCGIKDWPGVYTRVSKYMGWILRHMKP